MPPRPTLLVAALLAVLGLSLTACGDGDEDAEERTPFTRVEAGEQDEGRDDESGADEGEDEDEDGDGAATASLRDCGLEDAVAELTGDEVVEAGIRFGTVVRSSEGGDVQLNDEGCGYDLAGGDRFTLADLVDGEEATAIESYEALEASGRGTPVPDLGDSALLLDDDKLYVRTGDRIIVVKHDGDAPADQGVLEALAAEVIAVDAG